MVNESTRVKDSLIEREIAKFCDDHIYGGDISFERCNDDRLQKLGIDGWITIPKFDIERATVDEKVGVHYVNHPIKTYLMELSQITVAGKEADGWFINKDCKTEYYMLMYLYALVPQKEVVDKIVTEWEKINKENISLVEYFLVKKTDIMSYLKDCGFDEERLREGVKYLREHPEKEYVKTKFGFKFVISRQLKECPVNLCIERRIYDKICLAHKYVTKFDYKSKVD
jgi:hypothetical protein